MQPCFELADRQELPIPDRAWFARLLEALAREGALPRLSIALVDDAAIAELHGRFLGDPEPTDVLSFALDSDEAEIVVSVERAAAEAERLGCALEHELALYLAHGVLHLLGHDDLDEPSRRAMIEAEKRVLARVGLMPRDR